MSKRALGRRELIVATGVLAACAGCLTLDSGGDSTSDGGNQSDEDGGPADSARIEVGPDGEPTFRPATVVVAPGSTVRWEWDSDSHNISPTSIPDEATWEGHIEISDEGEVYEHVFETVGTYEYVCVPFQDRGMTGTIHVEDA